MRRSYGDRCSSLALARGGRVRSRRTTTPSRRSVPRRRACGAGRCTGPASPACSATTGRSAIRSASPWPAPCSRRRARAARRGGRVRAHRRQRASSSALSTNAAGNFYATPEPVRSDLPPPGHACAADRRDGAHADAHRGQRDRRAERSVRELPLRSGGTELAGSRLR